MPKRFSILVLVALLGLAVLAGCGSDSGADSNGDPGSDQDAKPIATSDADPVLLDSNGSEFNPSKVYAETIDGVVSIRSIFGDIENSPATTSVAGGSGFV
nr:hypothetical protein [Solirubrobacterales bacterium]